MSVYGWLVSMYNSADYLLNAIMYTVNVRHNHLLP